MMMMTSETTTGERRMSSPSKPTLAQHLRAEEGRIRKLATAATAKSEMWREDMAQELRLRAVKAWETWDAEKGPLSAHTWRYLCGSHLNSIRHSWTVPYGFRSRADAPSVGSLDCPVTPTGETWLDILASDDDGFEAIESKQLAARIAPTVAAILAERKTVNVSVADMIERLCCVEPGDIAACAKRQGVSIEAVSRSREKLIQKIREMTDGK